jgi:hypothetical protein
MVATDLSKRAVRSKPELSVATRSFAKPQDISKKTHYAKIIRKKTRKR